MAAATLTATPGTLLMRTRGRRVVMLAPGLAAVVGAGLMAVAANYQLLWLLVVGSIPLGVSFAQANNLRFAALEFAPAGSEPQALSLVVTGAVLAAVAGPEVARHTRNAMDPAYVGWVLWRDRGQVSGEARTELRLWRSGCCCDRRAAPRVAPAQSGPPGWMRGRGRTHVFHPATSPFSSCLARR